MIKTTRQLKDKVRNMSGGDSTKAQALIRNYIMEHKINVQCAMSNVQLTI